MYRVILKNEETGEELMNETYLKVLMLLETEDEMRCAEVVMNDNLIGMAEKIASSTKFRNAAKLAGVMEKIKDDMNPDAEDSPLSKLLGGL